MDLEKFKNFKLCFVADDSEYADCPKTLYFTELPISKQWGDDWDDVPYEHNAGSPYQYDYSKPEQGVRNGAGIYPEINILRLIIQSNYVPVIKTPRTGVRNSSYSVKDINKKIVPWLTIEDSTYNSIIHIQAGTTLKEVLKLLDEYIKTDRMDVFIDYNKLAKEENK